MTGAGAAAGGGGAAAARAPRPLPLQQHELHHQQMKIGIPTTQIKQQRNQRKAELPPDEDESLLLHALSVVADGYLVA